MLNDLLKENRIKRISLLGINRIEYSYKIQTKNITNFLPNHNIVKQLTVCQFTAEYYDYESQKYITYDCRDFEEGETLK
jgi:hypothetical protein